MLSANKNEYYSEHHSLVQYSERTIAIAETKDTSEESSDTELYADGKFGGVALSGGCHAFLLQKA